jgi:Tol biopolymer transport system component/chitodextrinase
MSLLHLDGLWDSFRGGLSFRLVLAGSWLVGGLIQAVLHAGAPRAGVDCGCNKTGDYVSGRIFLPTWQATLSPGGRYRIRVLTDTMHLTLQVSGHGQSEILLGPFPLAASWGFGPDDHWLVVHYPGASQSQLMADLYDLSATGRKTVSFGPMTTGSALLAFSPHGRYLLVAGLLTGNRTRLHLLRSDTGLEAAGAIEFAFEPGPGNPGNTFGIAARGFGPDDLDATFHYAFVKGNQVNWNVLNLESGRFVIQNFMVAPHAQWLFSPCGDIVALVELPTGQTPRIWLERTLDGQHAVAGATVAGYSRLLTTTAYHVAQTRSGVHQLVANSASSACAGGPTAPYWPAGAKLVATDVGTNFVVLAWPAAKDGNGDLNLYQVVRTSPQWMVLGEVPADAPRTFTVTGLAPGQWYELGVYAKDAAGNLSSSRLDLTVGTLKTPSGPVWPANAKLRVTDVGEDAVTFSWPAAADDRGVTAYRIYQDALLRDTVPGTTLEWRATGLQVNQLYAFKVEAGDADGNWTTDGPSDRLLTRDRTPPHWAPGSRLYATSTTPTSLGVGWTPAEDNVGVTAYRLYLLTPQGFEPLWDADYQFVYQCLEPETSYTFKVEANDAAGNWSTNGPNGTLFTAAGSDACAARLRCASVSTDGQPGQGVYMDPWFKSGSADSLRPSLSADGRYVAFQSRAANLVWGDHNSYWEKYLYTGTSTNRVSTNPSDIFVHDNWSGRTERLNLSNCGQETELPADGSWPPTSGYPAISANGEYVAFVSNSRLLDTGNVPGRMEVFVRGRRTCRTELISRSTNGERADADCLSPTLSGDGQLVAFASSASNLVRGDTNRCCDVFLHDRQTGYTRVISVNNSGEIGDGDSWGPAFSADGRFVAFVSRARNLLPNKTNSIALVYIHDLESHTTHCVSVSTGGDLANDDCGRSPTDSANDTRIALSADGRYVAFDSLASNLVPGDTNGRRDVFVHDRQTGRTERVSITYAGLEANGPSHEPAISHDGRYVAFVSWATNLLPEPTRWGQVYVFDRVTRVIEGVSRCDCGPGGGSFARAECYRPALSGDGRWVAFASESSDLARNLEDTNESTDVFVYDRQNGAGDTDNDGLPDTDEQGGPGGNPVVDVNADGLPDWRQFAVHTLFPKTGGEPVGFTLLDGGYGGARLVLVTLSDQLGGDPDAQQDLIRLLGQSARVTLADNPAPDMTPPGVTFPDGCFRIEINNLGEAQDALALLIWLPPEAGINALWKYGPTPDRPDPHWYEFDFDGRTGAMFDSQGRWITVWLVDGERGDDDLRADGQIVDVLAPARDGNRSPAALDVFTPVIELDAGHDHQPLIVHNAGGRGMDWMVWPDLPTWLTVSPASGHLPAGMSVELTVVGGDTGLPPARYVHDLMVVSAGGVRRIPVRMTTAVQIVETGFEPEGDVRIAWRSAPGRYYVVEMTDELAVPVWRVASPFIEATSARMAWVDYSSGAAAVRFYRIVELEHGY